MKATRHQYVRPPSEVFLKPASAPPGMVQSGASQTGAPPTASPQNGLPLSGPTHQQLIESCQGLVRSLAWKIHRKLPPRVELDDLIAYGEVGLAQAARDYDASRGCQFSTYAHYRIRGAIFDGLSKMSWFSAHDYHRSRYERMAADVLRLHGEDEPEGSAGGGGIEGEIKWFSEVSGSLTVVYLASTGGGGEAGTEGGGSGGAGDRFQFADTSEPAPEAESLAHELRMKLRELIEELPVDAASLIKSTYYEGLTLQEAGERIGISKAWASRLHARTLQRLADSLRRAGVAD